MAENFDVLICGSGSAGLCTAVWLARCGINFKILEQRPGPLKNGQADGVQCRTVEIFESLGISEMLLKEAYHVLEIAFWATDDKGHINRSHVTFDTEPGLSHQPHVILSQARINDLMINEVERLSGKPDAGIEYGYEVRSVNVGDIPSDNSQLADTYPVEVRGLKNGVEQVYRAKYVLGCDGAHSAVRRSIGFKMIGDSSDAVWGVLDVYPRTDFPDIRKKVVMRSPAGNVVIIPREGDSLVRFYIELAGKNVGEVDLEYLAVKAGQAFQPYKMEFAETVWWSVYAIGQRRADYFAKDGRVFLTGDACHTHSPKAGQGMNVSLQDGYNIGWKLAYVLNGLADPQILETYVSEREKTATELIEFDRSFTKLFSSAYREEHGISDEQFKDHFVQAGRFTAGQATSYTESILTRPVESKGGLASNLVVGMRFPSAQVVRFSDARAMHLALALPSDSRFHVAVFGGDLTNNTTSIVLQKTASDLEIILREFTSPNADIDSVINSILILSSKRGDVEQDHIPGVFVPVTGKHRIRSLHKVFFDDDSYNSGRGHAYKFYGIDQSRGAIVIIRPDLYISGVFPLEDTNEVRAFFERFLFRPGY